jgi:hypothetical protein
MELVHQSPLPFVGMSREFVGAKHVSISISFSWSSPLLAKLWGL